VPTTVLGGLTIGARECGSGRQGLPRVPRRPPEDRSGARGIKCLRSQPAEPGTDHGGIEPVRGRASVAPVPAVESTMTFFIAALPFNRRGATPNDGDGFR
jgi:hypothetical protein